MSIDQKVEVSLHDVKLWEEQSEILFEFYQLLGIAIFHGPDCEKQRNLCLAARRRYRELHPWAEMTPYERELEENGKETYMQKVNPGDALTLETIQKAIANPLEQESLNDLLEALPQFHGNVFYDKATKSFKPLQQLIETIEKTKQAALAELDFEKAAGCYNTIQRFKGIDTNVTPTEMKQWHKRCEAAELSEASSFETFGAAKKACEKELKLLTESDNPIDQILKEAVEETEQASAEEIKKLLAKATTSADPCTCGNPNPHVPGGIWCRK